MIRVDKNRTLKKIFDIKPEEEKYWGQDWGSWRTENDFEKIKSENMETEFNEQNGIDINR